MKIQLISIDNVLEINKEIAYSVNQNSVCLDRIKIDSALGAAFYPGSYPFHYGGIACVAGALCYFLIKAHAFIDGNKRTAAMAATIFMDLNKWKLIYPSKTKTNRTAFTEIIEAATSSQITKDELIKWFDHHKQGF